MGKIAFLFSGQGAQHVGMGKAFYESVPDVKALFDEVESYRPGTLELLFSGDEEELKKTENTQPCLYLADLAAAIAVKEAGITPQAAAGFSLGEIPALAFAGAYSYIEGFRIACKRGELMGVEAKKIGAAMVAVVKLPNETVEAAAKEFDGVYPVNYNSNGQLVVSLKKEALKPFEAKIKEAGGRVLPLKVGGGFHSPFMDEAAKNFGRYLQTVTVFKPAIPVYSNFTAAPYEDDGKTLLENQINHPVYWEKIISSLGKQGFDTFIETGVGTVLQKLMPRILPESKAISAETPEQILKICEELR